MLRRGRPAPPRPDSLSVCNLPCGPSSDKLPAFPRLPHAFPRFITASAEETKADQEALRKPRVDGLDRCAGGMRTAADGFGYLPPVDPSLPRAILFAMT